MRSKLEIRWSMFLHRLRFRGYSPLEAHPLRERAVRAIGEALYRSERWIRGARKVATDNDTCGELRDVGLEIEWGGMCPVQGDGVVDGRVCYYRSRGEGWQFSVAAPESDDVFADDAWEYSERLYFWPDGGYVNADVSERCIRKAIAKWREAGRP